MRAKLVQHINEIRQFKDPLDAMGVGMGTIIKRDIEKSKIMLGHENPLIWSVNHNKIKYVKYLLNNTTNNKQQLDSCLYTANSNKYYEIVKLLINAGADDKIVLNMINSGANIKGDSLALYFACGSGHLEITKLLIKNGANVNVRKGECLKIASKKGNLEIVKLLIKNGANVNIQGKIALTFAIKNNHMNVVNYLIKELKKSKK